MKGPMSGAAAAVSVVVVGGGRQLLLERSPLCRPRGCFARATPLYHRWRCRLRCNTRCVDVERSRGKTGLGRGGRRRRCARPSALLRLETRAAGAARRARRVAFNSLKSPRPRVQPIKNVHHITAAFTAFPFLWLLSRGAQSSIANVSAIWGFQALSSLASSSPARQDERAHVMAIRDAGLAA